MHPTTHLLRMARLHAEHLAEEGVAVRRRRLPIGVEFRPEARGEHERTAKRAGRFK